MELKNTLKFIGLSLLGILGVGLCVVSNPIHMHFVSENYAMASAYSVDDDSNTITLNIDELTNYSFDNLYDYIYDNEDISSDILNTSVSYNNDQYPCDDFDSGAGALSFVSNDDDVYFDLHWTYNVEGTPTDWTDSIRWLIPDDTLYANIKSAIELDITANTPNPTGDMLGILGEIIVLLTGGITGIASGVGSGVSTLVSDIFIQSNVLSVFGGILVVFAGISLAIGLCRWVMNFLTSLGANK